MTARRGARQTPWPVGLADEAVLDQVVERAGSAGFEGWWASVAATGYCSHPLHLRLVGDPGTEVLARCKNRRASVCPPCSSLYSGDVWQVVHAGVAGGHHGVGFTVGAHPAVFATFTAPSYGAVHTCGRRGEEAARCHPGEAAKRCAHGTKTTCTMVHDPGDPAVGQPLCGDCYDYVGHVLFAWHLPELWHRLGIGLRRGVAAAARQAGEGPKALRLSHVKVVEMQRRAVPHVHAVFRLDAAGPAGEAPLPPATSLSAGDLAGVVARTATKLCLRVRGPGGEVVDVRFGPQVDVQALGGDLQGLASAQDRRRVAAYLAKYVSKSTTDMGVAARPFPKSAIATLDVSPHVRRVLGMIVALGEDDAGDRDMLRWLHTLGYRGQVATKTRSYSTTMGALRQARADWRRRTSQGTGAGVPAEGAQPDERRAWRFAGYGHATAGEAFLARSAAARQAEMRTVAREELADEHTWGTA